VIIEAVRLVVTLGTTAVGYLIGRSIPDWFVDSSVNPENAAIVGAIVGAGVGYVMGGLLGRLIRKGLDRAPELVARATGPQLFAGTFGMISGLLVGVVISIPAVIFLPPAVGFTLAALIVLVLTAFGSRIFAIRAADFLAAAGLSASLIPEAGDGPIYVIDTSAAIDGRILELARAGLVGGTVWLPDFVIDELQGISDSGNKNRRRRGRRGLDVLDALRSTPGVKLQVTSESVPGIEGVDAKLLAVCERREATLVSTDHNLAQAAGLRGILVLNPHALGESLRPALVSGDTIALLIEREGSEPGQGVGFLDDGTMVVVEDAAAVVGETVDIEVANTLRTSVGRMVFARFDR